jgi:ferredoxin
LVERERKVSDKECGMMKATIIEDKCIGCGMCSVLCPEVFEMEDAVATVRVNPVPEGAKDECTEAAESCPVQAIVVTG